MKVCCNFYSVDVERSSYYVWIMFDACLLCQYYAQYFGKPIMPKIILALLSAHGPSLSVCDVLKLILVSIYGPLPILPYKLVLHDLMFSSCGQFVFSLTWISDPHNNRAGYMRLCNPYSYMIVINS